MRFADPVWFWLLLLVPATAMLLIAGLIARRRALVRFAEWPIVQRLVENSRSGRQILKAVLLASGVLFLVLALVRPQFGTRLAIAEQRGVDVVIALDVSRSMLAEDVRPNRLKHAVLQIRALLDGLDGHRVGLVLFAGKAFVQCPLTLDYGAVEMFLDLADAGSIPVQGTAVGDAVRVATRCFAADQQRHKAIVLFTDGEDHVGDPVGEAERAAATGVRIFTVGLGSRSGELIPVREERGDVSFHRDDDGNPVKTRLDESTLQEVALAADGEYVHSSLGGSELEALIEQLNGMDRRDLGSRRLTEYVERYQIPLAMALLCFFAEALLGDGRTHPHEWRGRFA